MAGRTLIYTGNHLTYKPWNDLKNITKNLTWNLL